VRQLHLSDPSNPVSTPEIGEVESVLSRAFTGDLLTAVVTGHDPKDPDISHIGPFWTSTIVAGLLGGEVYVAETVEAPHKIVGCAVWFGPGHTMYDTEDQQKYSLGPLMASFNEELQTWWHSAFLPKYDTFVTSVLGEGTKHNSWHLQTLAVDPAYQRKGAARLLVNTIVDKAKAAASGGTQALCVECSTEPNIEVYTKLGFHLVPKDKGGIIEDCKVTYTGVKGDIVPMWVLAMD